MPRAEPPAADAPPAPAWMRLGAFGLSLAGLAISIYLTIEHFTTPTLLACPDTGAINCAKVTTSPQSVVVGVPVAVLGLIFYVVMSAATVPPAWRIAAPALRRGRLIASATGVAFVLYLLYAELFEIRSICLWCTGVHLITVALFAVLVFGTASVLPATAPPPPPARGAGRPASRSAAARPAPATNRRRPAGRRR